MNALGNEPEGAEGLAEKLDAATKVYQETEARWRASLVAEESKKVEPERQKLSKSVELRAYVDSVVSGTRLSGAEAEENSELGLRENQVPWSALEKRAATTGATTVAASVSGVQQEQILPRVFQSGSSSFLQCSMPMVAVGDSSFPVFTSGVTPATVAAGAVVNATAATLTANLLTPSRVSARYTWRREDQARVVGFSESLRQDLTMSIQEAVDKKVIAQFLSDLTAPTGTAATLAYKTFVQATAATIDGRYALDMAQTRTLVDVKAYKTAAGSFSTDGAQTAISFLSSTTGGVRSSVHLGSETVARGLIALGMSGGCVVPHWEGITLVLDETTGADRGEISLTAIVLMAVKVIRTASYARTAYTIA